MNLRAPRIGAAIVFAALALLVLDPADAGSAEAGQAKSVTCAACHGADGNSLNPEWPSLAGQHASYIVSSLQAYQSGGRSNVLMSGQAAPLSAEDIADLAAYFSAQLPAPRTADPALVAAGERLYRGGNRDSSVSACIACHGPAGRGNPGAAYPSIAGQHATYTAVQLRAYRAGERASDPNQIMRNVAARLTDEEIAAVAAYVQGLR